MMPGWSVELHHDVLGKPIIVVLPRTLADALGPTLIVYGDEAAWHLEELRWDVACRLGDYREWDELLCEIRVRLAWQMPFPPAAQ
jgi:hypothetical protein